MTKTDWKSKAIDGTRNNKRLKKKIKELTLSRDGWKEKSIHHKARADKLESDLKKLKNRLTEIVDTQ
jgi:hypothetical protein